MQLQLAAGKQASSLPGKNEATAHTPPGPAPHTNTNLVCAAAQHHGADLPHLAVLLQHQALGAADFLNRQRPRKAQLVRLRRLQLHQRGGACREEARSHSRQGRSRVVYSKQTHTTALQDAKLAAGAQPQRRTDRRWALNPPKHAFSAPAHKVCPPRCPPPAHHDPRLTGGPAEAAQVELGGYLEGHDAILLQEVQRHLAKRLVPHNHLGAAVCGRGRRGQGRERERMEEEGQQASEVVVLRQSSTCSRGRQQPERLPSQVPGPPPHTQTHPAPPRLAPQPSPAQRIHPPARPPAHAPTHLRCS